MIESNLGDMIEIFERLEKVFPRKYYSITVGFRDEKGYPIKIVSNKNRDEVTLYYV